MLPKTERQMTAGKYVEEALYRIDVGNIVSSQSKFLNITVTLQLIMDWLHNTQDCTSDLSLFRAELLHLYLNRSRLHQRARKLCSFVQFSENPPPIRFIYSMLLINAEKFMLQLRHKGGPLRNVGRKQNAVLV
jgi:hypothetical protein